MSFAHGSNDGQKGMGLIMLVLIGIVPAAYALDIRTSSQEITATVEATRKLEAELADPQLVELGASVRTLLRQFGDALAEDRRKVLKNLAGQLAKPVEYVPEWVVMGVALCLGIGTMFGWERIVVTVGEKIGKTHLTYAQGGAAELVAASTIAMADSLGMPVSTTHVLSSGVAGTMWANNSGVQAETVREIALAWVLTLPVAMALSGGLYWLATVVTG